jgi:drug/metabolite transporter (DMT)-like permease
MQPKAFPYILLLSLFWGTNIVASRFGIGEFDPYLFIALRLAIATLFFVPISLLNGRRWPTDPNIWRHAVISGILGVAIPMTSFILSLQYQSSGVASIFVTASPAIIVIMAHFVLPDEKMTRNKALGLILALLGALFLVLRGESGLADVSRASPLGFILIMLGLVSEAINTMYVRRRMMDIDPMTVTGIRLLTGAIIALVIALWVADFSLTAVTPTGIFSLVYAALIGALAGQFTAFYIQRRFGATAFSLTSYLIPIVATTFGVLLLDEIVTWAMLVGIVLIGSGIYLISKRTAVSVRRMPIR